MGRNWNPFRRKASAPEGVFVVAQLNAKLQPLDRAEQFEEPLNKILSELGLGEVTGGGTMLLPDHAGIVYCDVEVLLPEVTPETLELMMQQLEELGAPKGSLLKIDGREDMEFGTLDGLALHLNGTDLPDEVYETSDINEVIETCDALLEEIGAFRGHWEGATETSLFFYGERFGLMKAALEDFIATEPLCQKARIEKIA